VTFASGDCCEGVWKEGSLSGECKFTSSDGMVNMVEFKTINFSGAVYKGLVKDGKMIGFGCIMSSDGTTVCGAVQSIKYPNGDEYNGLVNENGRKHGLGTMTYSRKCQHLIFFKSDCTCTEATYTHIHRARLISFSAVGECAYFHSTPSPMTPVFIPRLFLRHLFSFPTFSFHAYFHSPPSPIELIFSSLILLICLFSFCK
jgi:hypothetical protein